MKVEKLVELYKSRVPNSSLTVDELNKDIAFLLKTLTGEQIFFSINYLSQYHLNEVEVSLFETVNLHKWEILKHFELAKAKQARTLREESEQGYDQNNSIKGKNTPTWFGKSFDKHLFE